MPGPCAALHHAVFGTEISRHGRVELRVVHVDLRLVSAFVARFVALRRHDRIVTRHSGIERVVFERDFFAVGVENADFDFADELTGVLRGEQRGYGDRLADERRRGQVCNVAGRNGRADRIFDSDGLGHVCNGLVGSRQNDGIVAELVGTELAREQRTRRTVGAGIFVALDGDLKIGLRAVAPDDFRARKVWFVRFTQLCIRKGESRVDRVRHFFLAPAARDESACARYHHEQ